jgi:hypothetical protein
MRFRKKPVVIEAVQWDGSAEAISQIEEWIGDGCQADFTKSEPTCIIPTLEGDMTASLGDWIIKGIKGEVYPCKPDIFTQTYDSVSDVELV